MILLQIYCYANTKIMLICIGFQNKMILDTQKLYGFLQAFYLSWFTLLTIYIIKTVAGIVWIYYSVMYFLCSFKLDWCKSEICRYPNMTLYHDIRVADCGLVLRDIDFMWSDRKGSFCCTYVVFVTHRRRPGNLLLVMWTN